MLKKQQDDQRHLSLTYMYTEQQLKNCAYTESHFSSNKSVNQENAKQHTLRPTNEKQNTKCTLIYC